MNKIIGYKLKTKDGWKLMDGYSDIPCNGYVFNILELRNILYTERITLDCEIIPITSAWGRIV